MNSDIKSYEELMLKIEEAQKEIAHLSSIQEELNNSNLTPEEKAKEQENINAHTKNMQTNIATLENMKKSYEILKEETKRINDMQSYDIRDAQDREEYDRELEERTANINEARKNLTEKLQEEAEGKIVKQELDNKEEREKMLDNVQEEQKKFQEQVQEEKMVIDEEEKYTLNDLIQDLEKKTTLDIPLEEMGIIDLDNYIKDINIIEKKAVALGAKESQNVVRENELDISHLSEFYGNLDKFTESTREFMVDADRIRQFKNEKKNEYLKEWYENRKKITRINDDIKRLEEQLKVLQKSTNPSDLEKATNLIDEIRKKYIELQELQKKELDLREKINVLKHGGKLPDELNKELEQEKEKITESKNNSDKKLAKEEKRSEEKAKENEKAKEDEKAKEEEKESKLNDESSYNSSSDADSELSNDKEKDKGEETNLVVPPANKGKPNIKGKNPKLTWKTALSVAAGIGIGATVFFTAGPLGVATMTVGGMVAKKFIDNKRKKLYLQRINGELPIKEVIEPSSGIKGAFGKLKNYLTSEEGLRDISWMLESAILTGNVLGIAQSFAPEVVNASPVVDSSQIATDVGKYSNVSLGNSVEGYNVSVGNTNAINAISDVNNVSLNQNIINGSNSVFKDFYVMDASGNGKIISDAGTTLDSLIAQGYDPANIAINVARGSDGAAQAWVQASDLAEKAGKLL